MSMDIDLRPMIVLMRGCSELGRALAAGLLERGYFPVIVDSRTPAGPAEVRLVDLRRSEEVRRELLALRRDRGPADAIVILPSMRAQVPGEDWEHEAADELVQATTMVRAAHTALEDGGPIICVPPAGGAGEPRQHTVVEAIVELAMSAAAREEGVPLVRAPLRGASELDRRHITSELLAAVTGAQGSPSIDDNAAAGLSA